MSKSEEERRKFWTKDMCRYLDIDSPVDPKDTRLRRARKNNITIVVFVIGVIIEVIFFVIFGR